MTKIHFQKSGNGPSIVLIHGWGFNGSVWDDVVLSLQQHYTVTTIDLPGYGLSPDHLGLDLLNIVQQISEIIPQQSALVGWSLGGIIATGIAHHYPAKASHLLLVASTPYFIVENAWPGISPQVLENFYQQINQDYAQTLRRFIHLQCLGCDNARALSKALLNKIIKHPKPSSTTLLFGLEILKTTDLRRELQFIQCPTLAILGRLDSLVPAGIIKHLTKLNPEIQTVLMEKASHAPFLSHRELFIEHLRNFIG